MAEVKGVEAKNSASGKSPVFGVETSGEASASLGVAEADAGVDILNFSSEDGQWQDATLVDGHAEAGVSGGEAEASGSYGIASGEASAKALTAEAKASTKVTLMEEGEIAPQIQAEVKGEANVAQGEVGATIGNDYIDAHIKGEGKAGHAEAHAGFGAGKITYEDEDGNTKTGIGAYAEAGAEAYLAEGSVSGGISICGIKIDVKAEGKIGGAGAKAEAEVSSGKIKAGLGLGLLAGLGLDVEIDWSDFKWPSFGKSKNEKVEKVRKKKITSTGASSGGTGKTDITVYPKKLKMEKETFNNASNKISQLITQVNKIKGDLSISGAAAGVLKKHLETVADNMEEQKKNLKNVADTIENVSELYINTESAIMSDV